MTKRVRDCSIEQSAPGHCDVASVVQPVRKVLFGVDQVWAGKQLAHPACREDASTLLQGLAPIMYCVI